MNILVANISILPKPNDNNDVKEINYKVRVPNCNIKEFTAFHTNESVFKCLSQMQDIVSTGGISKIIMLVSTAVMKMVNEKFNCTAFDYYCGKVKEVLGHEPIFNVVYVEKEDKSPRDIHHIIKDVCTIISPDDKVYIDAAGGQRTINQAIQLLTKMLKYKGIENPYSLYANIQNSQGYIEDTSSFDKLVRLTESFNEFMTTGKSNQLRKCFEMNSTHYQYENLINAMCEVSDKIRLGNLGLLEQSLANLRIALDNCESVPTDDVISVVTNEFLPVIKYKFFGESNGDDNTVDYCRLVKWCLDNDLIQQALTLFVEKIPVTLFDRKLMRFNKEGTKKINNTQEGTKKNPLQATDWQTNAFYGEYLSEDKSLIEEAKVYLRHRKITNKNRAFVTEFERQRRLFRESKFDKMNKILYDKILRTKVSDESKISNIVDNDTVVIKALYGLSTKKENSLDSKFTTAAMIASGVRENNGFYSDIDNIRLLQIVYGYLYVKSVRNLANHASSEEQLNEDKKSVLATYGFNAYDYNVKTVTNNINVVLKAIGEQYVDSNDEKTGANSENISHEGNDRNVISSNILVEESTQIYKTESESYGPKIIGKIDIDSIQNKYGKKKR